MNITIDPEFQALIPPLLPDEYAGLEASILKDGCMDAVKVWKGAMYEMAINRPV